MVSANIVDEDGLYVANPAAGDALDFELQPVYFDADVEIENVVSGFTTKKIGGVDKKVVAVEEDPRLRAGRAAGHSDQQRRRSEI